MYVVDEEFENKEILRKYKLIFKGFRREISEEEHKYIHKAFTLALNAHANMRRKTGEPYIYHPLEVARVVVTEIGLGPTSVICSLLHDVVEDTDYTLADIEEGFGANVARIVDGLTKIDEIFDQNQSISLQAENFKKILFTLSDDVRVILIKLVDRLHNMRTLDAMKREKQLKIASETINIYAPLAHRLGLFSIKSELEDLAFKYTDPESYNSITERIKQTEQEREEFINEFLTPIRKKMELECLSVSVAGRIKSICSIYGKMRKKNVTFEEIYDLFAIRIVLDSLPENEKKDCYNIYQIVTSIYRPNPGRLRDWIALPKNNGYEALHTTVMSDRGKWVEVQIRSKRMDEIAEKGYAAHWKYKNEGVSTKDSGLDMWLGKIRETLENAENNNSLSFLNDFRVNFFNDEIYVYTPKGELKTLPVGASVLDFAFHIHSEIGFSVIGAKVNHRLVPINNVLKSGDQVEVIYSKRQKPTEEWLEYVVSSRAKVRIKQWLREEHSKYYQEGTIVLSDILKRLNIIYSDDVVTDLENGLNRSNKASLFYDIATEKITENDIKNVLQRKEKNNWFVQLFKRSNKDVSLQDAIQNRIENKPESLSLGSNELKKLDYIVSNCCNAIPGDDVIGIIRPNGGIEVHRINCTDAIDVMSHYGNRIVKAKWNKNEKITFLTGLILTGFDRSGILKAIIGIVSESEHINIRSVAFTAAEGVFDGKIMLYISNTENLQNLIKKLKTVDGLQNITRIGSKNLHKGNSKN